MKVIYVHHAERDLGNKEIPRQEQDITKDGIREAELLSKKMYFLNPTAIYTSPYKRCVHTTNILNKEVKIPVIEDARLNEYETSETFKEFLERNMNCIDDIINKYNEDDTVICVTSGINLTAFVCYFTGVEASSTAPRCQGLTMSPVLFTNDKKVL